MNDPNWTLTNTALQVWYASRYCYLDRAGSLCDKICEKFPTFKMDTANTSATRLINDAGISITFGYDTAFVAGVVEFKSRRNILAITEYFFAELAETLGITTFTRVGNRIHHKKSFESETLMDKWLAVGCRNLTGNPAAPFESIDQKLSKHEFRSVTLRTRDENFDIDATLKPVHKRLELSDEVRIHMVKSEGIAPEIFSAEIDVDIRTRKAMKTELFDSSLYFESNRKLVFSRVIEHIDPPEIK